MAGPRPTWKGLLKIALVQIPIKVFPATESSDALSFNQLCSTCKTRIQQKRVCPKCDKEVPNAEIVKGYEFEKGRYVELSDEDFEKVRPDSTRIIDIQQTAPLSALDPIHIQRSYYLWPDVLGGEAFATMREAFTGKVGIGKVALYGREYLVAVRPSQGRALVMHTLHHDAEVRAVESLEELPRVVIAFSQIRLAKQVIAAFEKPLNLADFKDEYKEGLRDVIDAKIAGNAIVTSPVSSAPVLALKDALLASLQAVKATKTRPIGKMTSLARKRRLAS